MVREARAQGLHELCPEGLWQDSRLHDASTL